MNDTKNRLSAEVQKTLANLLSGNDLEQLIHEAKSALEAHPDKAFLFNILGVAHIKQQNTFEAEKNFIRACRIDPLNQEFKTNLKLCQRLIGIYDNDLINADEQNFEGLVASARRLARQGDLTQAIKNYELAVALDPKDIDVKKKLSLLLIQNKEAGAKLEVLLEDILASEPDWAEGYTRLGVAALNRSAHKIAAEALEKAVSLGHDLDLVKMQQWLAQLYICDWRAHRSFLEYPAIGINYAVPPFAALPFEDNASRQLQRSTKFAPQSATLAPQDVSDAKSIAPIRVGLFSADFHAHATMLLIKGLLQNFDSSKLTFQAFSYGPDKQDPLRQLAIDCCQSFHNIKNMSNKEAISFVKAQQLDIAIDLKGFTTDQRIALFTTRLAPVQISYLGYPGTTGMQSMDYMIADLVTVPPFLQQHYSEKMLYLPHTYQPNDNNKAVSHQPGTKSEHGLPETSFVFCCFNNNYKISPTEFDIWMRLLTRIPKSVLWLLQSNDDSRENLRREAEARGIAGQRIIFAKKTSNPEHLGRHRHADLFLDTFNVNAHTTCSDALWAGLPVVTKIGQQFAARVGASLLNAIGLPELITHTEEDYEALAFSLATNPELLKSIREKLDRNRLTTPLFDTVGYTRAFEHALQLAFRRYQAGLTPDHILVPSSDLDDKLGASTRTEQNQKKTSPKKSKRQSLSLSGKINLPGVEGSITPDLLAIKAQLQQGGTQIGLIESNLYRLLNSKEHSNPEVRGLYLETIEQLINMKISASQPDSIPGRSQVIFGMGTGRSGSTTLTYFFQQQARTFAAHEHAPLLPWQVDDDTFLFHLKRIRLLSRYYARVVDVSHWWLPYVSLIKMHLPSAKFIVLKRDKPATIRSFENNKRDSVDHWRDPLPPGFQNNLWDQCYPKFDAPTRKSAISKYYDHYYKVAAESENLAQGQFLTLETETAFSHSNQIRMLRFCGYPDTAKVDITSLNVGTTRDGTYLKTSLS